MAPKREHLHIFVPVDRFRSSEGYSPYAPVFRQDKPAAPIVGRPAHGAELTKAIESATNTAKQRRAATPVDVSGATPGIYLEFESFPGWDLVVGSMEKRRAKNRRRHIEVVAVTDHVDGHGDAATQTQRATVFVPEGEVRHFLEQLEKYARSTPKPKGERRHENVYDRVASVRLAALRALWTDDTDAYPAGDDDSLWWEVWLRRTDGAELERLHDFAAQTGVTLGEHRIQFDDRIVTLAYASARALAASLDVLGDIAELQRAKETASFFLTQDAKDQAEWTVDLAARTRHAGPNAPALCILDTGINAGHPLLEGALTPADSHAYDLSWGVHDDHGHGTEMAGLALFGDLGPQLASTGNVTIGHRLESVKILPPRGQNAPDLYAAITAEAVSRPEIEAASRQRVFSMAVTSDDGRDRGQPTSSSAAIDALSAGRSFDSSNKGLTYLAEQANAQQRLFVISAGNVSPGALERDHLSRSDVEPVHDPAQAWNALTVGAFTEKVVVSDPSWKGWSPVARRGELSPWSTTSVVFKDAWPMKPDVVFEGGNVVHDEADNISFPCHDLCLLTTHSSPAETALVETSATSAATAQAAWLCGTILAAYPGLWPETLRALVIHSARWTDAMTSQLAAAGKKSARRKLVRRYGFGVPDLDRALRSASNAVTLIAEDFIRPFDGGKMRQIQFHQLPWPREALAALGGAEVRVRVTLSYFIEPNPGRRGWQTKHRYQSHGLRFKLKEPTESIDEFRKRLNQSALDGEEGRPSSGASSDDWYLGPKAQKSGSVHTDILVGSAADIAERGVISVYPVTGWWKEKPKRDRSEYGARYALVVSIETDAVATDIWTPIANQVGVEIPVH